MIFTVDLKLLRNLLRNSFYEGRSNHYLNELQASKYVKEYVDRCIDIHLQTLPKLPAWHDEKVL